jgi:hypothetical protein
VITDVAGQTVQEEKIAAAPRLNRWQWQAAGLASGLYFVRLETAQGVAVRKVVLE